MSRIDFALEEGKRKKITEKPERNTSRHNRTREAQVKEDAAKPI